MKSIIFGIVILLIIIFASTRVGDLRFSQNIPELLSNTPAGNKPQENSAKSTPEALITCNGQPLPAVTEGPYYKKGSPETKILRNGTTPGTSFNLTGYVLDTDCKPIANAWIDFWQADSSGNYDNQGFGLRGHQYTDQNGKYSLETIVPGEYPGRTPHIHAKVKARENGPELITQLFLPGVEKNQNDAIFNKDLLINIKDNGDTKIGTFNFIINKNL